MKELMPDSKLAKAAQYDLAWAVLLRHPGHEEPSADDIAHAKCWLTHRAVDGEISLSDWKEKIDPVNAGLLDGPRAARWKSSQRAAETWLWAVTGAPELAVVWAQLLWDHAGEYVGQWPPAVLNVLRGNVVRLAQALGQNQKEDAIKIYNDSISFWRLAIGSFEPKDHLWRFAEARDDLMALQTMNLLLMRAHLLPDEQVEWCNLRTMRRDYGQQGWMRAMREVSKPAPNWPDRATMAADCFRGRGVELGVAGGAFSATILKQCHEVNTLYSIDRWNDERHGLAEYDRAMNRLSEYQKRSRVMRASFNEAARTMDDASCDFVYIDGYAHTGQDAGRTLAEWWPKVRLGGVMAGHDYAPKWPLTQNAVDDFCELNKLQLQLTADAPASWLLVKR